MREFIIIVRIVVCVDGAVCRQNSSCTGTKPLSRISKNNSQSCWKGSLHLGGNSVMRQSPFRRKEKLAARICRLQLISILKPTIRNADFD
jgi:hypothetical protein